MLKERRTAVQETAAAFIPAEKAVEQAVILGARCIATMVEQRIQANLPPTTAAAPLQLIAEAMQAVLLARQKMIEAHGMLRDIPAQIGLDAVSYGDDGCPPNTATADAPPSLRIVG